MCFENYFNLIYSINKRITTNMSKEFCPTCGYKTLDRVVVTVDADGNRNYRGRRIPKSTKGLRVRLFNLFYKKKKISHVIAFILKSILCQCLAVENIQIIQY